MFDKSENGDGEGTREKPSGNLDDGEGERNIKKSLE